MKSKLIILSFLILVSMMPATAGEGDQIFPLSISKNGRYFVTKKGKPFLYHADTPWHLFYKLTKEEALEYMLNRKKQGFNTLQISISMDTNHQNRYNERPFKDPDNFLTVQDEYHDRVIQYVHMADSLGFLVSITQPFLGCCNGKYGTYGGNKDRPIKRNGVEKCRFYGEYLGKKFAHCKNVFWIMGGDSDPLEDEPEVVAMAEGLRDRAPSFQLLTYHASGPHTSSDVFPESKWLGFSFLYTYGNPEVYEIAHNEYKKQPVRPFILGESRYEGYEGNDHGEPQQIRRQAYWAVLSGSTGDAYGSSAWSIPGNWREIQDYNGAKQLKHFVGFFSSIQWNMLIPDMDNKLCVSGYGKYGSKEYVVASISSNKKFAVCYLPGKTELSCDLSVLKQNNIKAYWFNPRNGEYTDLGRQQKKINSYTPPTAEDWVLLFQ